MTSSQQQSNYNKIVNYYKKAIQLYHHNSRRNLVNQIENSFGNVGINLSNV